LNDICDLDLDIVGVIKIHRDRNSERTCPDMDRKKSRLLCWRFCTHPYALQTTIIPQGETKANTSEDHLAAFPAQPVRHHRGYSGLRPLAASGLESWIEHDVDSRQQDQNNADGLGKDWKAVGKPVAALHMSLHQNRPACGGWLRHGATCAESTDRGLAQPETSPGVSTATRPCVRHAWHNVGGSPLKRRIADFPVDFHIRGFGILEPNRRRISNLMSWVGLQSLSRICLFLPLEQQADKPIVDLFGIESSAFHEELFQAGENTRQNKLKMHISKYFLSKNTLQPC
jgi:hypothetical protein